MAVNTPPAWAARLTARRDALAAAALVAAAAVLRLVDLGWMPLDAAEAARALPAWRAAHGLAVERLPDAPLLFHLQRVVFALGADGDAAARLVPALAGTALAGAAAWCLPAAIGRSAALAAAAGFAFEPVWLFAGRRSSPDTLAALGVVVALGRWRGGHGAARRGGAVAAGLALAAGGSVAFSAAVAAAVVWGLGRVRGAAGGDRPPGTEGAREAPEGLGPRARRRGAAVFAATLGLAVTGLLSRPDGVAAWLGGLAAWARPAAGAPGGAWDGFVLPLAVYAPVLAVFGVAGVLWAPRRTAAGGYVLVWAAVALGIGLAGGGPERVVGAAAPLTLGAAVVVARLAASLRRGFRWGDDGVTAAILCLAAAYALAYAMAFTGAETPEDGAGLWRRAWLALVLAGALGVVYAVVWGRGLAGRVVGLTGLMGLGAMGWSNGARLNYRAALDLREPLRPAYVAPPAERLARDLADASRAATGDALGLPTVVDPALADALAWPLRARTALTWSTAPGADGGALVVTAADAAPPSGDADAPRSYAVSGRWTPEFAGRLGFLRWYLQRRPAVGANPAADGPVFQRAEWRAPRAAP